MKHLKNPYVAFALGIAAGFGVLELWARKSGQTPPSAMIMGGGQ